VAQDPKARINHLKGRGQPLTEPVRAFLEPRFSYDFSQVRLHTDARAAEAARPVNAKAYTIGEDVMFWEEQYAHETTVVRLSEVGGEAK